MTALLGFNPVALSLSAAGETSAPSTKEATQGVIPELEEVDVPKSAAESAASQVEEGAALTATGGAALATGGGAALATAGGATLTAAGGAALTAAGGAALATAGGAALAAARDQEPVEEEGDEDKPPLTTTLSKDQKLEEIPTTTLPLEETSQPPTIKKDAPVYRHRSNGVTCILLQTDGLVLFKYKTKLGEMTVQSHFIMDPDRFGLIHTNVNDMVQEKDKFIPDNAETSGSCNEDSATFSLTWSTFKLLWFFAKPAVILRQDNFACSLTFGTFRLLGFFAKITLPAVLPLEPSNFWDSSSSLTFGTFSLLCFLVKTPGGERWYVDKIELSYNSSESIFEHVKVPGRMVHLSTSRTHSAMLFPTPVGKSYSCQESSVELKNGDSSATVLLRVFQVQPFIFKGDDFGPEYECSSHGVGSFRDETAPIAVGSTLAIVVLLTVTGYGIYRYFKVEKVQYDTME
nr:unnamed protein product [Timema californicum]